MPQLITLALCALLAVLPPSSESVREPESKVAFPVLIGALGSDVEHELIGTGIRTKTIFKLKVYALGLYVDAAPASLELAEWEGKSARRLRKNKTFYKAVSRGSFGKTLRIVMTREVDADDWIEDFREELEPRIREYEKRNETRGGKAAVKRLQGFFDMKKLKKKDELLFTTHPDGRMVVSVCGKLRGEVSSPVLSWALLDAFLGSDPISDSAKKTLIRRAPMVITRELKKDD